MTTTITTYDENGRVIKRTDASPDNLTVAYTYPLEAQLTTDGALLNDESTHYPKSAKRISPLPMFTDEQAALLSMVWDAYRLLSKQKDLIVIQIDTEPAGWPAMAAATNTLLLKLAHQFLAHLGLSPESLPNVVVPPPPVADDKDQQQPPSS